MVLLGECKSKFFTSVMERWGIFCLKPRVSKSQQLVASKIYRTSREDFTLLHFLLAFYLPFLCLRLALVAAELAHASGDRLHREEGGKEERRTK